MSADVPHLLLVTDRTQCEPRELPELIDTAIEGGIRAVLLREKDLPPEERRSIAAELKGMLAMVDGVLIVASDPTLDADGLHLAADDPFPEDRPALVGRSCHSLEEVQAAEGEGCDYVTLSPIFESISKPEYGPILGLDELRRVCATVSVPVLALGGVQSETAAPCFEAGAAGIAVMGAVMSARFASVAVERLLNIARPYEEARVRAPVITAVSLTRKPKPPEATA